MRLKSRTEVPAHLAGRPRTLSKRCTHLIAEDSLTPKRAAAARRLIPSRTTASITRSAKSCEELELFPLASAQPAG